MRTDKATITVVGWFNERGQPVGWEMDCRNCVPAWTILDDGSMLWGGYSLAELHAIAEKN